MAESGITVRAILASGAPASHAEICWLAGSELRRAWPASGSIIDLAVQVDSVGHALVADVAGWAVLPVARRRISVSATAAGEYGTETVFASEEELVIPMSRDVQIAIDVVDESGRGLDPRISCAHSPLDDA